MAAQSNIIRIGVFYDGNFYSHVSNYYQYSHKRKARINIRGLHEFIRNEVAEHEGCDVKYCHLVEAHFFRGRPRAAESEHRGTLLKERQFDDVLVREGIVPHYLLLGPQGEKGIDVWLALEAYEQTIYKRFDVVALIVSDGDFLPLMRKLTGLGARVMLLAWDFRWTDPDGTERETKTAQVLLEEATYPVMMSQLIDDRSRQNDPLINGLFLAAREPRQGEEPAARTEPNVREAAEGEAAAGAVRPLLRGRIQNLLQGYGFIEPESGGDNVFFYHTAVEGADFNELEMGEPVTYRMGRNNRGPCAVEVTPAGGQHRE